MVTVIYADVLFFINFIIDGLCISVSMLVLGRSLSVWRLVLGCAIGGLYSVLSVYLVLPLFAHLLAAVIICIIAFSWQGIKAWAVNTTVFFLISALLGGILYAVYTLFGTFSMYNGAFYAELSTPALIASSAVIIAAISVCLVKIKKRAVSRYATLKFTFKDKCCTVSCLYDSGNMLTCPYTALPVAIIGNKAAKQIFSEAELASLSETPVLTNVRPIPVSGIAGSALLPSFIPKVSEIKAFGDSKYKSVRLCIAVQADKEDFGGSDGILPACIL